MMKWDIYEISSAKHQLVAVKCRGRIRKYAIEQGIDLLTENATDAEGRVRFALLAGISPQPIEAYIRTLFNEVQIERVLCNVQNPVLSKLKINDTTRYDL